MTDRPITDPAQEASPTRNRVGGVWLGIAAHLVTTAGLLLVCETANRGSISDAARWLLAGPVLPRLLGLTFVLATLLIAVQTTGRRWLGIVVGAVPWALLAAATSLKREVTGDPLIPADLLLSGGTIGAAVSSVPVPWILIVAIVSTFCLALLADHFSPGRKRPWRVRLAIAVTAFTAAAMLTACSGWLVTHQWLVPPKMRAVRRYATYGLTAGFVLDLRELGRYTIVRPEGYSSEAIAAIAARHRTAAPAAPDAALPSIIMVQLESVFDPTQTGVLPAGTDVLPNLHALHRQFGAVQAIPATFGSRSANSEFELNTGLSMALLPPDSIAYEHVVRRAIPSVARVLAGHGYRSTAIICGNASMFRYGEVYPIDLGFDQVLYADTLMPEAKAFNQIPDAVVLSRVAQTLQSTTQPMLITASTAYTHTPWLPPKYPIRQYRALLPRDLPQREDFAGYLQGIHECDAAIGQFIQQLAQSPKPVIVFFYGDHQPGFAPVLLRRLGLISGNTPGTPAEILATHTTVAAFWTNVPGVKFPSGPIGLNLVGSCMLDAAGIQHPFYTGLLGKVRQHTRATVPGLYLGSDGIALAEPPSAARQDLRDCELLQYDLLSGSQYSIGTLFAPLTKPGQADRLGRSSGH